MFTGSGFFAGSASKKPFQSPAFCNSLRITTRSKSFFFFCFPRKPPELRRPPICCRYKNTHPRGGPPPALYPETNDLHGSTFPARREKKNRSILSRPADNPAVAAGRMPRASSAFSHSRFLSSLAGRPSLPPVLPPSGFMPPSGPTMSPLQQLRFSSAFFISFRNQCVPSFPGQPSVGQNRELSRGFGPFCPFRGFNSPRMKTRIPPLCPGGSPFAPPTPNAFRPTISVPPRRRPKRHCPSPREAEGLASPAGPRALSLFLPYSGGEDLADSTP